MARYRNRKSCKKPKSIKSNRRKTSKGGAIEYIYKYGPDGKRIKVRVKFNSIQSKTPKSKTPK